MFIQLDCGCIGLLIEGNEGEHQFYHIIDCAREWYSISFHKSNDNLKYKRFRQLKDEELEPIIQLIQRAIAESGGFQEIQSALNLPNQQRVKVQKNLDAAFVEHRTMKAINTIDKPKVFPFDYRDESEKQKESEYINRHSK